MAGHSKWAQIKHKKAAVDAKRGQLFSKLVREIIVATRLGGPDPDANPRLRVAIERARQANMPRDRIERAIARGAGRIEGESYEEIVYEGYAPHGVALLIEVVTDNRNRAVSEVRHVLTKWGGSLGESGSVAWQFETKGQIVIPPGENDPEEIALAAIDVGAEDVEIDPQAGVVTVFTSPKDVHQVAAALEEMGYPIQETTIAPIAKTTISLPDDQARKVLRVIEELEGLDDVQRVHSNLEISDALFAELTAA